jgi:hypothetical protein
MDNHSTKCVGRIAPLEAENIQPQVMLAHVKRRLGAKNDAQLAEMLGVSPSQY